MVDDRGFTWDNGVHVVFSHYDYFDNLLDNLLGGAWVHLVGTYDGANWNLYRNGTLLTSAPDTSGVGSLMVLKGNWAIGARGRWAHCRRGIAGPP